MIHPTPTPATMGTSNPSYRRTAGNNLPMIILIPVTIGVFLARAGSASANAFSCRDKSVCRNYSTCSQTDALYRSGHLCRGFPTYNGGPPILKFHWETELQSSFCKMANESVCLSWGSSRVSSEEWEFENCTCDLQGSEHCQTWTCLRYEIERCSQPSGNVVEFGPAMNLSSHCSDYQLTAVPGSSWTYRWARGILRQESEYVCTKTVGEVDSSDSRKAKTNYCVMWHCTNCDGTSTSEEEYVCVSYGETYCSRWEAFEDGSRRFQVSSCECTFPNASADGHVHCGNWTCSEKGLSYYDPELYWCLFGIFVATPSLILCLWSGWTLIAWAGFMFVSTILGGIGSLLISLAIQSPVFLIIIYRTVND